MAAAPATAQPMRRERRKLEVRTRITEAGVELFDAHGFADTTVAQICERADVAHKTFFNHFATKQDLLREIAMQSVTTLLEDIRRICAQEVPTPVRLRNFFDSMVDSVEAGGPMHRELVTEIIYAAHESGTDGEQQRALYDAFSDVIRAGRAAGDIPDKHSLQSQAELVLGTFYVLMFNWAHMDGYPLRKRARDAARLLADSLCAGREER